MHARTYRGKGLASSCLLVVYSKLIKKCKIGCLIELRCLVKPAILFNACRGVVSTSNRCVPVTGRCLLWALTSPNVQDDQDTGGRYAAVGREPIPLAGNDAGYEGHGYVRSHAGALFGSLPLRMLTGALLSYRQQTVPKLHELGIWPGCTTCSSFACPNSRKRKRIRQGAYVSEALFKPTVVCRQHLERR